MRQDVNNAYMVKIRLVSNERHQICGLSFSCRMLRSLLSAQGVNPQMITVFIDGYYEVKFAMNFIDGYYEEKFAMNFHAVSLTEGGIIILYMGHPFE